MIKIPFNKKLFNEIKDTIEKTLDSEIDLQGKIVDYPDILVPNMNFLQSQNDVDRINKKWRNIFKSIKKTKCIVIPAINKAAKKE